jgi:hypothetical protein
MASAPFEMFGAVAHCLLPKVSLSG